MLWIRCAVLGASRHFEVTRKQQPGVRMLIDSTRVASGTMTSRAQRRRLLLRSLSGIVGVKHNPGCGGHTAVHIVSLTRSDPVWQYHATGQPTTVFRTVTTYMNVPVPTH
jgi:hypothetical protein